MSMCQSRTPFLRDFIKQYRSKVYRIRLEDKKLEAMSIARKGFVFLGAAGVGKGTFADIICSSKGWKHISTGDLLRSEIKRNSDLGNAIKQTINSGGLVSDSMTNQLVRENLSTTSDSFILDGYPRSINQAQYLTDLISRELGGAVDFKVVHITLREDVIIRKLLGRRICATCGGNFNIEDVLEDGFDMPAILVDPKRCKSTSPCNPVLLPRDDDTKEAIEQRLSDYRNNIGPILDHFQSQGVLSEFKVKKGVKDTDALLKLMLST